MKTESGVCDRRRLLKTGTAALAALAFAKPGEAAPANNNDVLMLWPAEAPGGTIAALHPVIEKRSADINVYSRIASPRLLVYRPATANGAAIILAQGGGYVHIANSSAVPAWFSAHGFTVFDLLYRLPGEGWCAGPDAPKQDVLRAIRLVRQRAATYAIDPGRIGVAGFSAGGHVAGTAATAFAQQAYAPVDDADRFSARPDFALLSCPVITMLDPSAHAGTRRLLIGDTADEARQEAYSVEKQVTAGTPPAFLVHADNDRSVPAENSILFVQAMRRAGVSVELHLYSQGGHGMGPDLPPDLPASHWPEAMVRWFDRLPPKT